MAITDEALRRVVNWPPVLRLGQRVARSVDPVSLARLVPDNLELSQLSAETASLLNLEKGPRGFAAAAGLWFNPPVGVWYGEGEVSVKAIAERIVEVPYVFGSVLRHQPEGASILDFGASESTVALSLASMGYRVTALDSRGYPFQHPNLTVEQALAEAWDAAPESFDQIIAISAIEHVGIGYYDSSEGDRVDDLALLSLFRRWLRRDGLVTVTVPYGQSAVDDFQRTYDERDLDRLFQGWDVVDRRVFEHTSATVWQPGAPGATGVAIVSARP